MDEQSSFEPRAVLGPRRAGWSRLAIALPALALAGIAWIGMTGPRSGNDPADRPPDQAIALDPAAPSAAAPDGGRFHRGAAFPETILGLRVHSVQDVNAGSLGGDTVVAVAGWYIPRSGVACPPAALPPRPELVAELGVVADTETFCDRSGVLLGAPEAGAGSDASDLSENRFKDAALLAVPVEMRPGIAVPPSLDASGNVHRIIVIGQLVAPGSPCNGRGCGPNLVVDRIIWAGGVGQAQTTSIAPRLLDRAPTLPWRLRDAVAEVRIGPTTALLMEALVDPSTLRLVDPDAAAAVEAREPGASRIWYRLSLGQHPSRDAPRWVTIDDMTGDAIASGSLGSDSLQRTCPSLRPMC